MLILLFIIVIGKGKKIVTKSIIPCFIVAASDPDRTTLFQKISIPKFTWNWMTTNTRPKIKDLLDCGSQCSISNYNTLLYNDATSACILANVRYLKMCVVLMLH